MLKLLEIQKFIFAVLWTSAIVGASKDQLHFFVDSWDTQLEIISVASIYLDFMKEIVVPWPQKERRPNILDIWNFRVTYSGHAPASFPVCVVVRSVSTRHTFHFFLNYYVLRALKQVVVLVVKKATTEL